MVLRRRLEEFLEILGKCASKTPRSVGHSQENRGPSARGHATLSKAKSSLCSDGESIAQPLEASRVFLVANGIMLVRDPSSLSLRAGISPAPN